MLISSADGGDAINDAVRVSARLVDLGRKLAGSPPLAAPKDGAQFHFSQPGSVQGFAAVEGARARRAGEHCVRAGRALEARFTGLGLSRPRIMTPTFTPPEVTRMRTYELMATPLVYSGQRVRARVIAHSQERRRSRSQLERPCLSARRRACRRDVRGRGSRAGRRDGSRWRFPDTGGQPIQSIGIAARAGRGAGRCDRPRLASLGRPAGRSVAAAARTERLLAPRLGQRGRQFLDHLPAGLSDFAGPRRRHDHSRQPAVARLSGRDGADGSSCRTRRHRRSRAGPATVLRASARAAECPATGPRSGRREDGPCANALSSGHSRSLITSCSRPSAQRSRPLSRMFSLRLGTTARAR